MPGDADRGRAIVNRLTIAGVGGGGRSACAHLALDGRRIVVDCGPEAVAQLRAARVDLAAVDTVCVTHLHAGHAMGLGTVVHAVWAAGRVAPLQVWGPPGTLRAWAGFRQAMAMEVAMRVHSDRRPPLDDVVRVAETGAGVFAPGPVLIRALRVAHPPVEQALAFRIDGSRSVTFMGDGGAAPELAGFARLSDLLVAGAVLPEAVEAATDPQGAFARHMAAAHLTVAEAAVLAGDSGARRLVLAHLWPAGTDEARWRREAAAHWAGPVIVAQDGLEIEL